MNDPKDFEEREAEYQEFRENHDEEHEDGLKDDGYCEGGSCTCRPDLLDDNDDLNEDDEG
jgi:hypothetical protein